MAGHTLLAPQEGYNLSEQGGLYVPRGLLELSLKSMKSLEEELAITITEPEEQISISDLNGGHDLILDRPTSLKLIPIKPVRDANVMVIGVDASCIKLGETCSGLITALRGAIVWRHGESCRYLRIGPLVFHITEHNKVEIYNALKDFCLGLPGRREAPSLPYMPIKMANIFEHWMRELACSLFSNALVLLDGSLSVGPGEAVGPLKAVLELARSNSSVVMAISKNSKLRFMGKKLIDMLNGVPGPYLLEIGNRSLINASCIKLLGRTYVARLSPLGCTFRLDIDMGVPREAGIEAVRLLVASDAVQQGYPEVLRLAHIICTFTAPEVMAMQLALSRAYGLRIIRRPDVRRLLFGPFGSGGG